MIQIDTDDKVITITSSHSRNDNGVTIYCKSVLAHPLLSLVGVQISYGVRLVPICNGSNRTVKNVTNPPSDLDFL